MDEDYQNKLKKEREDLVCPRCHRVQLRAGGCRAMCIFSKMQSDIVGISVASALMPHFIKALGDKL